MISVLRLQRRMGCLPVGRWMLDSGAFSQIAKYGAFSMDPWRYAQEIAWWSRYGTLEIAAAQDYMCERAALERTGLSVTDHQRLTIERYDMLLTCRPVVPILPVLQGYKPTEYADHVHAYGDRLNSGMWVGVGSVCKRNAKPAEVLAVLKAVHAVRPDLRLHGFGLKTTALRDPEVMRHLFSADSMAWSYAARRQGRNANDWREAKRMVERVREVCA